MKSFKNSHVIAFIGLILGLNGCSQKEESVIVTDPKALYEQSVQLVQNENFDQAILNFDAIDRDFPASEFAVNSNMIKSYALYSKGDFIDAIFAAEDFIKKYPAHPNVDYMYYIKALCEYDQIIDVERDQKQTFKAKNALDELILRYPYSKYIEDAKRRRLYTYNAIAGNEMAIANLYLSKGRLIPALIRYHDVVKIYNDTIFIEEALYRLTEIYYKMGMKEDAKIYASVLGHNYQSSPWYRKAYNLFNKNE